jgi:dUTP pyrophosphatase
MAKIHADKAFELQPGERFVQGVFIPFGIVENDEATAQRHGGMGSTGTK